MLNAILDKTERALPFCLRRARIEFALVVSACCLWFLPAVEVAYAGEPAPSTVEFPAWSRTYVGIVGGRQIEVALTRVDSRVEGAYCFAPCTHNDIGSITVQGTIKGDRIRLSELRRDLEGTQQVSCPGTQGFVATTWSVKGRTRAWTRRRVST